MCESTTNGPSSCTKYNGRLFVEPIDHWGELAVQTEDGADAVVVLPTDYAQDWMERTGRKLKMEYVGMGSVFTVIFKTAFANLPRASQSAIATIGTLFLFMGLKKKTRDHISCSLLLFLAAALAGPGVTQGVWFVPYVLFGACVWAMEGYLEKRRTRIYTLPLVLGGFAATGPGWVLGLAFAAAYLLEPRPLLPGLRQRLTWLVAVSAVVAAVVAAYVSSRSDGLGAPALNPPAGALFVLYASIAVITVICLSFYWRRLAWPHRVNAVVFGVLAACDARIVALFGMTSMIVWSATIFRHGIDSDRLRPYTKHAEWYFFPLVFTAAIWVVVTR